MTVEMSSPVARWEIIMGHRAVIVTNCVMFPLTPSPSSFIFMWNFHPLEALSRWRDPQFLVKRVKLIQIWPSTILKYCWLMSRIIFKCLKADIYWGNRNRKKIYIKCACSQRLNSVSLPWISRLLLILSSAPLSSTLRWFSRDVSDWLDLKYF